MANTQSPDVVRLFGYHPATAPDMFPSAIEQPSNVADRLFEMQIQAITLTNNLFGSGWIGRLPTGIQMNTLVGDDMPFILSRAVSHLYRSYRFRDPASVTSFISKNPFLIPVLLNARNSIAEHFEGNTPLALEVFSDPEEPEADQLFLFIQTSLSAEQARERLRRLDMGWWVATVPSVRNKLTIDTELVSCLLSSGRTTWIWRGN